MTSTNLEKLERAAFRTSVDHGFFDLLLGAILVALTLAMLLSPWIALVVIAFVIAKRPLLKAFNRRVVEPRVGYVRLSSMRLDQISNARKAAALAFFGIAFIIHRLEETARPFVWLDDHAPMQIALIAAITIATAGWLFQLRRFMFYAVVVALTPALAVWSGLQAVTGLTVATLIVLGCGGIGLYQFVHRNPVQ